MNKKQDHFHLISPAAFLFWYLGKDCIPSFASMITKGD